MLIGLVKWVGEFVKGVYGFWEKGRWIFLVISVRYCVKIWKEILFVGGYGC